MLNRLAGQHLALAALLRAAPPLGPPAAAAALPLRQGAFEAAQAQELDLFRRCGSAVVYQNLASRTLATQWKQPGGDGAPPEPPPQERQQEGAAPPPAAAHQQHEQQQQQQDRQGAAPPPTATQQQQQQEQQRRPAKRSRPSPAAVTADVRSRQGAGTASRAVVPRRQVQQLEEADLDWDAPAADVAGEAEDSAATAAAGGGAPEDAEAPQQAPAPSPAGKPPTSAQTELGSRRGFKPLAPLPVAAEPCHGIAAAAAPRDAAGATAGAGGLVQQQVALFVRAELHPLLRKRQISQELHDAGEAVGEAGAVCFMPRIATQCWRGWVPQGPRRSPVCRPINPTPARRLRCSVRPLHCQGAGAARGRSIGRLSGGRGGRHPSPGAAIPTPHAAAAAGAAAAGAAAGRGRPRAERDSQCVKAQSADADIARGSLCREREFGAVGEEGRAWRA